MDNSTTLRKLHRFWAAGGAALALVMIFCVSVAAPAAPAPPEKLKILISNDDGIDAPGLLALAAAMSRIGSVTVAAPLQNSSGASHGKTSADPIFVTETQKDGVTWYAIRATPATCVRLAIESLLPEKPDLVLSGINKGENLGLITYYSATLGAAREAAFSRIAAIALNLSSGSKMDYSTAADFSVSLVAALIKNPLKPGLFLNVNVPSLPREEIKGVMAVPLDLQAPYERFEKRTTPGGQVYFWNTYRPLVAGETKTDVWAVRNGFISVTPFSIDPTIETDLRILGALKIEGWSRGAGKSESPLP